MSRTTYVYDPIQKKVVEKSKRTLPASHAIHTMEPFVSPIDGSIIRDGAQLAAHNRKHGVTDHRDYGPDWFERKHKEHSAAIQGQTETDKAHRIELLKHASEGM